MVLEDLTSERVDNFWFEVPAENIPGSTRVPVLEIKKHLLSLNKDLLVTGAVIVDLGAGSGRSTKILGESFPGAQVIPLDLSFSGLQMLDSDSAINASVDRLPFADETVDVFTMCGVMTNLVGENPVKSLQLRLDAAKEIKRALKKDGLCVISDFTRPHLLSGYSANYQRHKLITGEDGTIAVFKPSEKISFVGLDDVQVANLSGSTALERFAHHYKPEELIDIFTNADLKPESYIVEIGSTPSGKPIDTITLSVTKKWLTGKNTLHTVFSDEIGGEVGFGWVKEYPLYGEINKKIS